MNTMSDWNPELYRRFEDERTRPARDLLAQVGLAQPRHVVDLGCGPGNSTQLLVERFPAAHVLGLDNSQAMLEHARERLPGTRFLLEDIDRWQPEAPVDLVYANASLQWLPDHETLLPHLFDSLAPGGVLAAQMPDNLDEPSHRLMREVAAQGPWADSLRHAGVKRARSLPLEAYHDLLTPRAARVDLWRTAYQHPMDDAATIVDWLRATGLRPFLEPLPDDQQAGFLDEYTLRIDEAYSRRADGRRLLAFPRLFIVARRAA